MIGAEDAASKLFGPHVLNKAAEEREKEEKGGEEA